MHNQSTLKQSGLSLAVDFGTTTINAALLDRGSGAVLARANALNPQILYGCDIMTRLDQANRNPESRRSLREAGQSALRHLAETLCRQNGIVPDCITGGVIVANTAMHHLLLGLDVAQLAAAPYIPTVAEPRQIELALAGLPLIPFYFAPLIGGFVGSDAVAGILAAGLMDRDHSALLIDIGTNTEICLWHRGQLSVCSAPSGPAFEGGGISKGMRLGNGAVTGIRRHSNGAGALDTDEVHSALQLDVVGGGEAIGFCGTGLIDAISLLLEEQIIDAGGRISRCGQIQPCGWPRRNGTMEVRFTDDLVLTQEDIRKLQLAKGAVRSGIDILMAEAGAKPGDLECVILSGAFGSGLNPQSAVQIGLIPQSRVQLAGNTALAGAEMMAASKAAQQEGERIARVARHIALAGRPDYFEHFLQALNFADAQMRRSLR